jgi:hypothetical protein
VELKKEITATMVCFQVGELVEIIGGAHRGHTGPITRLTPLSYWVRHANGNVRMSRSVHVQRAERTEEAAEEGAQPPNAARNEGGNAARAEPEAAQRGQGTKAMQEKAVLLYLVEFVARTLVTVAPDPLMWMAVIGERVEQMIADPMAAPLYNMQVENGAVKRRSDTSRG